MKPSSWVVVSIGILFCGLGIFLGMQAGGPNLPAPTVPGVPSPSSQAPAADFRRATDDLFAQSMTDADGKPTRMAQWRGKPLLVNFWATWCPPCVEEIPALSALQKELSEQKMQIIGIGIDSAANIKEFSSPLGIGYPLYVGGMGGSGLTRKFGNKAGSLPYTVLISGNGHVMKTYLGKLDMVRLRADIAAM